MQDSGVLKFKYLNSKKYKKTLIAFINDPVSLLNDIIQVHNISFYVFTYKTNAVLLFISMQVVRLNI